MELQQVALFYQKESLNLGYTYSLAQGKRMTCP